jgi:hypothetical protein
MLGIYVRVILYMLPKENENLLCAVWLVNEKLESTWEEVFVG